MAEHTFESKIVKAKKKYKCDASDLFNGLASYTINDCETVEQRLLYMNAQADNFKILPGQKYRKTVCIVDGMWQVFRCRLDMDELCNQLKLYEE